MSYKLLKFNETHLNSPFTNIFKGKFQNLSRKLLYI